MLLGESIDAQTALHIGLVAPEELMGAARTLAERVASKEPLAVRAMKRLMREGLTREQRPTMKLSARMPRWQGK